MYYALMGAYIRERVRTLGDMKKSLNDRATYDFLGFGVKGVAYFNSILEQYDIEPFGVRGRHPPKL